MSLPSFAQQIEWRSIPAGEFVLGCGDEKPTKTKPRRTKMPAFHVMPLRVTVGDYSRCVEAGACTAAAKSPWCDVRSPELPVTCTNFPQAEAFCAWAGGRLPTDAEWEYVADLGTDMNAGVNVDDKHGATEWVSKSPRRHEGYEGTRGGIEDLTPRLRCDRGDSQREHQGSFVGFRCVRAVPPPFPRVVTTAKRELVRFVPTKKGIALRTKATAQTFAVCSGVIAPFEKFLGEVTMTSGDKETGGPWTEQLHEYEAPCRDVAFVIDAPDVSAGKFRRSNEGRIAGCVLSRGKYRQELHGLFGKCDVKLAGDLNDDGVSDFLVHREIEDPCVTATLLLSSGEGWSVFADDVHFCPD